MAIETGAIFKRLYFDGQSSGSYGVYITGEAVYNSPERDVEMIKIPGRNGALALDKGRFENIEVTYKAGLFGVDEADFANAISDFRNFLCSRDGYVRLEDDYNPNEYRMAVYKNGLNVDLATLEAGEFDITFDCKPQRWLTSGEEPVTIGEWGETETASGDIVTVENEDGVLLVKSLTVDLEPIQSGSGTPSPDNVRPISGRTEVVTQRTGKNLLPNTSTSGSASGITRVVNADGTISLSGTSSGLYLGAVGTITLPSGTYVVNGCPTNSNSLTLQLRENNVNGTTLATDSGNGATITLSESKTICACTRIPSGQSISTSLIVEPMIRLASISDATYEPYQGTTYTTALGQTVYGGTLDVVSGELVVDRAMVDLGSLTYARLGSTVFRFQATLTGSKGSGDNTIAGNIISDIYKTDSWSQVTNVNGNTGIAINAQGGTIAIQDNDYADATSFETAMNGHQLVYELATPQTYQLTAQQIELLTGTNNIWDDGDVTVEYGQNPMVLLNPTLFESQPLLAVDGYGEINIGDAVITIENSSLGEIVVHEGTTKNTTALNIGLNLNKVNTGDAITMSGVTVRFELKKTTAPSMETASISSMTNATGSVAISGQRLVCDMRLSDFVCVKGTDNTMSCELDGEYATAQSTRAIIFVVGVFYDAASNLITIEAASNTGLTRVNYPLVAVPAVIADSTLTLNTNVQIDLDIGEAWAEAGGEITSLNNVVNLPAKLPTLSVGETEITYDNTITSLEVTPRWWRV